MTQLEHLINLEKNRELLDQLNSQLIQLKNGVKIKAEETKHVELLNKLTEMEIALNTGKTKLRQSDYTLKDYELKLKDLDKELFSGSITNEKQLKFLTSERERINKLLETLETEILENMDAIGTIENEINNARKKLEIFKGEIHSKKEQVNSNIDKLEKAKVQLNANIINITKEVEDKLIGNYEQIRQKKGSAIAIVKNGVCSGCNIMVPNYQHEDIKKNRIIHCESCNRILYIPQKVEI